MKYKQSKKQNQRILQITESTLVVGADIAKKTHVARAVDYRGIELGVLAKSNAEFVNRTKRIVAELGKEIATPDEARKILKLTKN
ncbi:hypothetical protein EXW96_03640 [Paenibacillus sp. JMULE4]|nr:3-keto-5-aminohexanoate cleavage protein [Paenibacillus sp. JMULE4]NTZ16695.1 hypothetical protein [Paenibacillus sp. JMULE4]